MDKRFTFAFALAFAAVQSFGAVYYVATDGSDSAAGTKDKPFATLNKANKVVAAGDTVWIRGGIYDLHDTVYVPRYKMTAAIHLTASGESDDNRIHYFAYPGERPIFDATNLPPRCHRCRGSAKDKAFLAARIAKAFVALFLGQAAYHWRAHY
ncbi:MULTISPECIES: hypothetical protein [unclassified Fibrobacter]|uniref:right-handed parallel beta-helix repeat-containing protein n=1 Tax=unclassified Fibrobacter TaxID=2634177 RepID=UPI0025C225E8|nr:MULTISPECIES: hypothetical protein [unclassified Fibrobacter]